MSMDLVMSLLMETGSFDTDAKRSIDQLNKIEKAAKQLTKALSEGRPGAEDFVGPLQPGKMRPVVDGVENLNRAVQKSQSGFRASNQVMQQASYQITDFVVQVSGGVSAVRAFGQQAPQLLAAFGGVGAAIGTVVALGAAFVPMLLESIGATKSFDDAMKASENAISSVASVGRTFDMTPVIKQFNDADEVTRQSIIQLMNYKKALIDVTNIDLRKSFSEQVAGLTDTGFFAQFSNAMPSERFAETMGISVNKQMYADLRVLRYEYGSVQEFADKYATTLAKGNEEGRKFAKTIIDMARSLKEGELATKAMNEAQSKMANAGATGIIPIGKDKTKESATKEAKSEMDMYVESINKAEESFMLLGEKRQYLDSLKESLAPEVWEKFSQDLDKAAGGMNNLDKSGVKLAQTFEQAFGQALQQGVAGIVDVLFEANKSFGEFAANFVKMIAKMITQLLILRAIEMTLSSFGFGQTGGAAPTKSANGNVFDQGGIKKFANGGIFTNSIFTKPTAFAYGGAFGSQAGLMGEAGPEAVMPLTRGRDGKLGVAASGIGGGGMAININVKNEAGGDGYQATATARKNDTGFDVDILVRKALTNDLRNNGPMSQTISSTYGLSRRTR